MDKKGHIYVSKLITNILEENNIKLKRKQKIANTLGNLLPDLKPSFLSVRHNMEETFDYFKFRFDKTALKIQNSNKIILFRIGEIIHYICDYFIYPHNPSIWTGSLSEHIKYEKQQHKAEFLYIKEKKYKKDFEKFKTNLDISENKLIDIIKHHHEIYLTEKRSIYIDCKYITCMLLLVLQWLFFKFFNIFLEI